MSFLDFNGDELAVNDQVAILGLVSSLHGDLNCFVDFSRQGSPASLEFVRTEPVVYTVEGNEFTAEITGASVNKDDHVVLQGTVAALAAGIHPVANVVVIQNGQTETLTLYCAELIKTETDGDTVTGVVSGPS